MEASKQGRKDGRSVCNQSFISSAWRVEEEEEEEEAPNSFSKAEWRMAKDFFGLETNTEGLELSYVWHSVIPAGRNVVVQIRWRLKALTEESHSCLSVKNLPVFYNGKNRYWDCGTLKKLTSKTKLVCIWELPPVVGFMKDGCKEESHKLRSITTMCCTMCCSLQHHLADLFMNILNLPADSSCWKSSTEEDCGFWYKGWDCTGW
jgi:hypothetical protein